ncbi:MAG: bifunctional DNA-formamidopyrimidine glycosylase/DNA-(apurinic or apyrimidinic site) lyase [Candidatus Neomarinimicrobiota bacterium]|nr:MAG: bifunctional DNA-formamidopyrimidine glycosylase/DNA-(apurinic or apyrimidinic site) lyase [Candidatus Neomarinimicrobiota bacterium]
MHVLFPKLHPKGYTVPELPEVETVVRVIRPRIEGLRIRSIRRLNGTASLFNGATEAQLNRLVKNQRIRAVTRRGKYIVLELERGVLLIHLRMTGRLLFRKGPDDPERHFTARIDFQNQASLWFRDMRKFGRITYCSDRENWEGRLGPEPLSDQFTLDWLRGELKRRHRKMKALLLDQSFLAGLGNIYVDEVLWAARIHPETLSHRVSQSKAAALHRAIRSILQASIDHQGTTIINFAFGEGKTGNFRSLLQVFGRTGKPCPRCGTAIKKVRVNQRGTHFCPVCQKR